MMKWLNQNSGAVQAVATVVLVAVTAIYAYLTRSISREMKSQREDAQTMARTTNLLALAEFLQNSDARAARRHVLHTLASKPYVEWTDADRLEAGRVCSSYDLAGILVRRTLVDKDLVVDNWGPSIFRCYQVLRPHIQEMQTMDRGGSRYWDDFVWLQEEARKHHVELAEVLRD